MTTWIAGIQNKASTDAYFNQTGLSTSSTFVIMASSGTPDGGPDGIFDSGMIGPNSVYEYEFSNVGEFEYYCLVHPWMTGIIVVE